MTLDAFQVLAEEMMGTLPPEIMAGVENVVVVVEDWPDQEARISMQLESPYDLLGLYQGWPLPGRGVSYAGHEPDMIHLYREPILAFCVETGEELAHCVRHVLIHEIGHYFGFSDEAMEAIECPN